MKGNYTMSHHQRKLGKFTELAAERVRPKTAGLQSRGPALKGVATVKEAQRGCWDCSTGRWLFTVPMSPNSCPHIELGLVAIRIRI